MDLYRAYHFRKTSNFLRLHIPTLFQILPVYLPFPLPSPPLPFPLFLPFPFPSPSPPLYNGFRIQRITLCNMYFFKKGIYALYSGITQGQYWSIQEGACGTAPALVWRTTRYQSRGPLAPPLHSWQLSLDKLLWRLLAASGATHWHGACRIMMMMMMMMCSLV